MAVGLPLGERNSVKCAFVQDEIPCGVPRVERCRCPVEWARVNTQEVADVEGDVLRVADPRCRNRPGKLDCVVAVVDAAHRACTVADFVEGEEQDAIARSDFEDGLLVCDGNIVRDPVDHLLYAVLAEPES